MRFVFCIIILFALMNCGSKTAPKKAKETYLLHDSLLNDDFDLAFVKPANFDSTKQYHLVFIADGNIGLGDYISGKTDSWKATIPANCVVVTIGHHGDWHEKRQRDFIPADISHDTTATFGKADQFYNFLKNSIVPFCESKYNNAMDRSFMGHSFSGLFCLYASLKNDGLFKNYFAISPSVWANYGELLKIEDSSSRQTTDIKANVYIVAGGLEVFNRVLSSSKEFYDKLSNRKYPGLHIEFSTVSNANHFSVRKPAADKFLSLLAKQ